jgi:hypothetical protein
MIVAVYFLRRANRRYHEALAAKHGGGTPRKEGRTH